MAYKSKKNADLIEAISDLQEIVNNQKIQIEKLQDEIENYKKLEDLKICGNCLNYKNSRLLNDYICGLSYKKKSFNEFCDRGNNWKGVNDGL